MPTSAAFHKAYVFPLEVARERSFLAHDFQATFPAAAREFRRVGVV